MYPLQQDPLDGERESKRRSNVSSEFLHLKMESDLLQRRIIEARLNICDREYGETTSHNVFSLIKLVIKS